MTDLADVVRQHGAAYERKYGAQMLPSHRKVLRAIRPCRTDALGGHVYTCSACDQVQYRYHSCRNRHCPKCQTERAQVWLETQTQFLLPVPYFLLTFTLPKELRQVARSHQQMIYHLLFRASAQATQHLALDPRFVGGQIGMIGVLHTWGRNLSYHPHVHYLVPAGGLAAEGWRPAAKKFLLPVKALSKIFRARFRDGLRKDESFADVPARVWRQKWVVHCKPVGDGESALKYLAPYIFRVAISNQRILRLEDSKVTFRYRDTQTGQNRVCKLAAEEFMRRFLQHVLPKGFVKVRYYGLFSPAKRRELTEVRTRLEDPADRFSLEEILTEDADLDQTPTRDCPRCPVCEQPMTHTQRLKPAACRPP